MTFLEIACMLYKSRVMTLKVLLKDEQMKNDNQKWEISRAKWISKLGCESQPNLYLQFVRRFETRKTSDIFVYITAVSQYQLFVNGQLIGRGPAESSPSLYYYHIYKLPPECLNQGENLLAILLYHPGNHAKTAQGFDYGKPGLLCSVEGVDVDFVSDNSWKVEFSPVYSGNVLDTGNSMISPWGGYKELYHGDKEDNWTSIEYDHLKWENAIEVADAISQDFIKNLIALDVRELETNAVYPERIVEASKNLGLININTNDLPQPYNSQEIKFSTKEYGAAPSIILDFSTIVVGYPEIDIQGDFYIYELWYGETLDMYRLDVIRRPEKGVWRAFQRRSFRYIKIKFIALEENANLRGVRLYNTWYAYNSQGKTVSSDKDINKILNISRHTSRVNTSYHFEDCPWRERALWVQDFRIQAKTNYYTFGNPEIVAKCLRQMFALQKNNGLIPPIGPMKNELFFLDYCLHLIGILKEYYIYSADLDFVKEVFPYVERLVAFVNNYKADDGLLDSELSFPKTVFLTWNKEIEKRGKSTMLNSLYSKYLEDLSFIYELCDENKNGFIHEKSVVKARVNELLFDLKGKHYHDTYCDGKLSEKTSFESNLMALYADFVPIEYMDIFIQKKINSEKLPMLYNTGSYEFLFNVLAKLDKYKVIIGCIRKYWGAMISRKATTWWEVFDPETEEWVYPHPYLGNTFAYEKDWIPVSSCHGWGAIPSYAIPCYLLGVDFSQVYKNKITIKPGLPGYFERFTYKLPLKDQLLWIEFYGDGSKYEIEVIEKPDNISVEISKDLVSL